MRMQRLKLAPRRENFLTGCRLSEFDGDALGVSVHDSDAVAVSAHFCRQHLDPAAGVAAKQLAYLFLQLFFFILNEGNDVTQDVERRHARVACAADRLHGADEQAFDAESLFQRLQREHQADGGTVGIGHQISASRALVRSLCGNQVQVIGIDLRDYQRHIRRHAKCA